MITIAIVTILFVILATWYYATTELEKESRPKDDLTRRANDNENP